MYRKYCFILFGLLICLKIDSQTVRWAVRPISAQIEESGDLIKIRKDGKCGMIDRNNQEVIPALYDSITVFRDGYAIAMNKSGKQLKIEAIISEGDYEVQPLSEEVFATRYLWFSDGKMPVRGLDGWGYIGTDGNIAIPCQFQQAYPFSEGFASVKIDDKAYFINRNMDYLNIEAGYGDLVFASTFSGGEAVVYSRNMKGYVINRHGRTIRSYKVKASEVKPNKYDHSIDNRTQHFFEQIRRLQPNNEYMIYEENGLYGYKKGETIVLPAQLEKAEPVRGEYAEVRYCGQDGVLQMIDGNFTIQIENNRLAVEQGNASQGTLSLNLPPTFEDTNVRFQMYDEQGKEFLIYPNITQGELRTFSFKPTKIPVKNGSSHCSMEVWIDNLLLWKDFCNVNYIVKETPKEIPKKTKTPAIEEKHRPVVLSLSPPQASSKRANPKNDFYVTVAINNKGDVRGVANVSLYVDGKPIGSKNVNVRGRGVANAIFTIPDVKKERYAKVKAILKNSGNSHEANIRLVPFY